MSALQFAASPTNNSEKANYNHLVLDIVWFGLAMPAIDRFREVYAIRLGADANQLTLLASLPALVLLFASSLAGRWMSRYSNSTQAVFWPGIGFRLAFLLPALTAFMPASFQLHWLTLAIILPSLAQGISAVGFVVMMRESVHEKKIAPLHSHRMMALNITVALSGLAMGFWLERVPFPYNYQSIFVVGFIFALMSLWHVNRVRVLPELVSRPVAQQIQLVNPWRSKSFQVVVFVVALSFMSFTAIKPLISLHLIKNLGANEWYISMFGLADLAAGAIIAIFVSRISQRFGNRYMIAMGLVGTGISALLIATTHNLNMSLVASAISGASWMMVNIGQFAFFSEMTPVDHKERFTTAYHQVVFLAMFIGPLIGKLLGSEGTSLVTVLLIGGVFRVFAGILTQVHIRSWFSRARQLHVIHR